MITQKPNAIPVIEDAARKLVSTKSLDHVIDDTFSIAKTFNALKGEEVLSPKDTALVFLSMKMQRLASEWSRDKAVELTSYSALIGAAFARDDDPVPEVPEDSLKLPKEDERKLQEFSERNWNGQTKNEVPG